MTYSSAALLALMVQVIIHFDVIGNRHYRRESPAAKSYRALIFSVILFHVFDALWGVLYEARLIPAVFADTALYFIAMAASVFFWTRFVIHYLKGKDRFAVILSGVGWIALAFFGVSLILNLFRPLMFWFDAEGVYHAGDLRYITLAMQVLLFLSAAIFLFITAGRAEGRERTRRIAIGMFGTVMAFMVVLQVLFPLQPMYTVSCLLGTCILHTFVIADMKEDRRLELEKMLQREQVHERELGSVKQMAYTDALTGVKSSHAYVETEKKVDLRIAADEIREFGVVVFDLNGLKQINDTKGHDAGDCYIKEACRTICRQYKHSPVFRIGGDEFVAFLEGEDYANRKDLLEEFDAQIEANLRSGNVVVATGMAVFRYGHDNSFRRVFERADQRMYDRKGLLKTMNA